MYNTYSTYSGYQPSPIFGAIQYIDLAILIIFMVALWKIFIKAQQPGWAAIIPIYNWYIVLKIARKPGWWLILFLIPIANIVVSVIVAIELAKAFGKSTAFGVIALWLFSIIGYLILAFDSSEYVGTNDNSSQNLPPSTNKPAQTPTAAPTEPVNPPTQ